MILPTDELDLGFATKCVTQFRLMGSTQYFQRAVLGLTIIIMVIPLFGQEVHLDQWLVETHHVRSYLDRFMYHVLNIF